MRNEQNNEKFGPIPEKYLALYVVMFRKQRGWTQETLAELTKLNVRTIQRIEKGESAGPDARRALAVAFELEDIDIFNRPVQHPDEAALKEEYERIKKETITLVLKKVTDGRQLREMSELAQACQFNAIEDLPEESERCFAELQDYLQDYACIYKEYTAIQKLTVNTELQEMLDRLEREGVSLGIAVGRIKAEEKEDPFFLSVNHYIAASSESLPEKIILNKSMHV
jgi:transcriptional regulator with XRE-family HTH domain